MPQLDIFFLIDTIQSNKQCHHKKQIVQVCFGTLELEIDIEVSEIKNKTCFTMQANFLSCSVLTKIQCSSNSIPKQNEHLMNVHITQTHYLNIAYAPWCQKLRPLYFFCAFRGSNQTQIQQGSTRHHLTIPHSMPFTQKFIQPIFLLQGQTLPPFFSSFTMFTKNLYMVVCRKLYTVFKFVLWKMFYVCV